MADQPCVVVFNKSFWKTPRVHRASLSRWPRGALIKRPSEISEEQGCTVEVNSFLRNVGFLHKWPIHLLVENEDVCRLWYFNRGQVLLLDSTKSEWIYIVKSGSISVLQKVQKVKPEEYDDLEQSWVSLHGRRIRRTRDPNRKKSSPRLTYMDQMKLNQQFEQENCIGDMHHNMDRLGLIDYTAINNDQHSKLEGRSPNNKKQILAVQNDLPGNSSSPQDHKLPELVSQMSMEAGSSPIESEAAILHEKTASSDIMAKSQQGKHKIMLQKDSPDDKTGDSEADPLFLLIQVLERGQNFGVNSLVFDDQPALSVVSNGAECILLCKKFYLQHASEYNMENLKRTEYPYPSLQKMQENLQGYMKWVSFRADIYNEKVKLIEKKKKKRKQCLPQYTGQYNHRTGPR